MYLFELVSLIFFFSQIYTQEGNCWLIGHLTPVLLPGKSHGWRSLVGCSPWGRDESDTTEQLPFNFSLSCIGEGNGNPLQCSSLENPRDGGAWWAAVYGVAQSRTWLKQLSNSSSNAFFARITEDTEVGFFFSNEEETLEDITLRGLMWWWWWWWWWR